MTKQVSASITINTDQKTVFDIVTDWNQQEKWVALTKVRGVGDDSKREGGKIEAFTGVGSLGFIDTMTITKWEQNKLCEVTHTGNVVRGKGVFEVSTHGSSTVFTWSEYVEVPLGFLGSIFWPLIEPFVGFGMKLSLRKFKRLVETK